MKFNKYIWELYKTSVVGKKTISESIPFKEIPNLDEFLIYFEKEELEEIKNAGFSKYIHDDKVNIVKIYHDYFRQKNFNIEAADKLFDEWINEGVKVAGIDILGKEEHNRWWEEIEYISNALYVSFSDFFFPYFFLHEFNEFQAICVAYNIALPKIPKKRNKRERTIYYLDICRALYEFRISNELSPEELIAFIYDFAPNTLADISEADFVMSEPSKVWYVGGGQNDFEFLDHAQNNDSSFWQCNIDTRVGDILIMYCGSPRSHIHSVWRAITDGFIDPFFYYHTLTYISNSIKVPPITFTEMKDNPILSKSPLIAKNLQGLNGYPVTQEEYQEMLRLWETKGLDTSILPKIEVMKYLPDNIILKDEKDIEVYLIEPMLLRLKYKATDWIRQMPVKMGRGERYYPDYCFGAVTIRGEESAKMLIEAKYSVRTVKNLQDAYFQAKSYAMRLQADRFIIASKEGIWLYNRINNNFYPDKKTYFTWNDLENPDKMHELSKMLKK